MKISTENLVKYTTETGKELILPYSPSLEKLIELIYAFYYQRDTPHSQVTPEPVSHIKLIRVVADLGLKDAYHVFNAIWQIEGDFEEFETRTLYVTDATGTNVHFKEADIDNVRSIHSVIRKHANEHGSTSDERFEHQVVFEEILGFSSSFSTEQCRALVHDALSPQVYL